MSGLATSRFAFEGFLSTNRGERARRLDEIKSDTRTLIFYEAPHKLKTTLSDLYAAFGDRKISLCRELTKLNEEIVRVSLSEAVELYNDHEPRGEYVLIVEGASEQPKESEFAGMSVVEQVEYYISHGMTKMEAVKACARERGVPKNEVYKAVVGIEADKGG